MTFGGIRRIALASAAILTVLSGGPARSQDPPAEPAESRKDLATPVDRINMLPGFKAELLYSVPGKDEGSWVSLCVDDKGRLITSDQYGKLYRLTVSAPGVEPAETKVEPIDLGGEIGMAQGLLYAFDSLYVVVNSHDPRTMQSGLYRVRDTDGDDQFDKVELLRAFEGGNEHGPHGVILSPDGKSLYICAGNHTPLCDPEKSLVPRNWKEDYLLTRLWDAGGHAHGIYAPGGYIVRTDPDGKLFELVSIGFRNQYDIAFNADGELFTYDSDMEWDIGAPWYVPTRVNHVTSGSEFGWRSGTARWPADYPDSLGSVVDIGNGSPTGIVFGAGARFPEKYQRALFISDWSYGIVYAVHLTPDGASYTGVAEKFMSAQPLPVTDLVVHPDGSLYLTIGGRRTQSGLYRVTYVGEESTNPVAPVVNDPMKSARELRYSLERLHGEQSPYTVDLAWPHLSHPDRTTRFTARIAVEHQPVEWWAERAIAERDPIASIQAIIALARCGKASYHEQAVEALNRIDWNALNDSQRIDLLRAYELVFIRLGQGTEAARKSVLAKLDGHYPNPTPRLNLELSQVLVYLEAPGVVKRTLTLFEQAPTQEEQIHYLFTLMELKADWTPEDRERYFKAFTLLGGARGGHSFMGFIRNIRKGATELLAEQDKEALKLILDLPLEPVDPASLAPARPFVKNWTVDELLPTVDQKLHGRDYNKGRTLFSAAQCFKCHRVRLEGGSTGPDLTGVGNRFNHRDLLESLIEPSKVVSDQYEKTIFQLVDGRVLEGRVINLNQDQMMVMTNMFDPNSIEAIKREDIEVSQASKVSMMPAGLLDTFTEEEILDLVAYLKAGGDPNHGVFQASGK